MKITSHSVVNAITLIVYSALMAVIMILPSGSISGINIKAILLVFVITLVVIDLAFTGFNRKINNSLMFMVLALLVLMIWLIIGVLKYRFEFYGLSQFKEIATTIIVTWVGYICYVRRIINWNYFFNLLLYSHIIYILVKTFIFVIIFIKLTTLASVVYFIKDIFGINIVSFSYVNSIARLDLLNDTLSPFFVFFLLNSDLFKIKVTSILKLVMYPLLIINTIIGFKRSLILIAIAFIAYSIMFTMSYSKRIVAIIIIMISVAACFYYFNTEINYLVGQRFSSKLQENSDSIRDEQYNCLLEEFYDNALIGKGLGGYSNKIIRSEDSPYSYEIQWLSFLMQFGIIGIVLVICCYSMIILPLFRANTEINYKIKFILIFQFIAWGCLSFTNPLMTSTYCSSFYTLILLASINFSNYRFKINQLAISK